jgi:hypothetical protein
MMKVQFETYVPFGNVVNGNYFSIFKNTLKCFNIAFSNQFYRNPKQGSNLKPIWIGKTTTNLKR